MSYDYPEETDFSDETEEVWEDPPQPQYFAVSRVKFVVMSILTFGFYELYWFYKNWCAIRDRDGVSISPFWRAFFAPVHYRRLIHDVDAHRDDVPPITPSTANALVVGYYVLPALWRLPYPFWLSSMCSWAVLLPVVSQIAAINQHCPRELLRNSRWTPRHLILGVMSVPVLLAAVIPLDLIPGNSLTSGSRLWDHNTEFLQQVGLLQKGEKVLYFYSDGVLSIEDDGNILTDAKVISYWKDAETKEFFVETARYEDIATIETDYSDNFTDPTVITVFRNDGSDFILVVSSEENRDVTFVDELESRLH